MACTLEDVGGDVVACMLENGDVDVVLEADDGDSMIGTLEAVD